jgi:predicted DCC family thiol-disulfide oxidoreductase YuxK
VDYYGSLGFVQAPIVERLTWPLTPRLSWVTSAISPFGIDEGIVIRCVFAFYLLAAFAFVLGWRTRLTAICLWLSNLIMMTSASPHMYGFDLFVKITLFYCVFAPVGNALSVDVVAGRTSSAPSFAARLSLRVLQAHLAVVYAATGIEKASGIQWWTGEALWRALMRPDLGTLDFSWIAWTPWVAAIGCWATLVIEIGYAVFIWPRRTRKWWALATIGLHVGIALTLGLIAFAGIMIILTLCAWLVPCEMPSLSTCRKSQLTIGYDGSCRVCRSVVGLALALSRRGFTPVGRNHIRRIPALGDVKTLNQMMAVAPSGQIRTGVKAFFRMWAHSLGWPWLETLAERAMVRTGYALFAKHRHALGCRGHCSLR